MENTTKLILNIYFAIMLIPAFMYGELWMFVASFFWWYIIAIVAISGGYHRYYSHDSFKAGKWYEYTVNVLGMFAGAGPALTWASTHKQHHAYSDTELDPHSHSVKGMWAVYVNTWGYGFDIEKTFIKHLFKDRIPRWFYKYYFKLNIGIIVGFICYRSIVNDIWLCNACRCRFFHGYGILNILDMQVVNPTNSWLANILTAGEGWHANRKIIVIPIGFEMVAI